MEAVAESYAAHRFVYTRSALTQILDPEVNLCVWLRKPADSVSTEVAKLAADSLPDVRSRTCARTAAKDAARLLEGRGFDPDQFPNWLKDIADLAAAYEQVSGEGEFTLRLETLADDGCTRFHVDRTSLRLICTYRGPGTEWLPNMQADRQALQTGAENESIIRYGQPWRFATGAVGIMKGSRFPGNASNGLVHRSPPVAASGEVRVLVCLDR